MPELSADSSDFTPQLKAPPPTASEINSVWVRASGTVPPHGNLRLCSVSRHLESVRQAHPPQQTMKPSIFTPQLLQFPALTEVNLSSGGVSKPKAPMPQPETEPSVFNPQVKRVSVLTEMNSPAGIEKPETLLGEAEGSQQSTVPSVLTPQAWYVPALTEANSFLGGACSPSLVGVNSSLS